MNLFTDVLLMGNGSSFRHRSWKVAHDSGMARFGHGHPKTPIVLALAQPGHALVMDN